MRSKLMISLLLCSSFALADEQTYWAEIAQNPLADIIKLPIESRFDGNFGANDALNYRFAFQPSMVSETAKGWNIVNRLDIPFHYQPGRKPGERDSFGLGDITYESWFGPSNDRKVAWGLGPAFQIPTATDNQIGTRKWSAGVACATSVVKGPFVAGARANHLWSFAGNNDRADVNRTAIEYFLYANLGNGWWVGTSPVNIADWDAPSDERWTVPVGGGVGKVVGRKHPVNLKFEAYSYAEAPTDYADWSVIFGIELLVPENSLFKR